MTVRRLPRRGATALAPTVAPAVAPAVVLAVALGLLAGCALAPDRSFADVDVTVSSLAVAPPPAHDGRTHEADLLVVSAQPVAGRFLRRLDRHPGVRRSAPLGLFSIALDGGAVTLASGVPADLRGFAGAELAGQEEVWERVAAGQAVLSSDSVPADGAPAAVALDPTNARPAVAVAAVGVLPVRADLLVNQAWAAALGAPADNAVLLDTRGAVGTVGGFARRLLGDAAQVVELTGAAVGTEQPRPAYLTGGAVAEAVGSFTYVPNPDGSIEVDDAWVAASIVTEEVPILGRVTCHRVMLPQLRGALQELVDTDLADLVQVEEYGGCWVPRFIGRDPTRPLSLHSWGIAVDLNVASNQLGTVGEMDPRVVDVMARWGFAWGGTWSTPDPMHFELAALLAP